MHPRAPIAASKLLPPSGKLHPTALDRLFVLDLQYLSPPYQLINQSEAGNIDLFCDSSTVFSNQSLKFMT